MHAGYIPEIRNLVVGVSDTCMVQAGHNGAAIQPEIRESLPELPSCASMQWTCGLGCVTGTHTTVNHPGYSTRKDLSASRWLPERAGASDVFFRTCWGLAFRCHQRLELLLEALRLFALVNLSF